MDAQQQAFRLRQRSKGLAPANSQYFFSKGRIIRTGPVSASAVIDQQKLDDDSQPQAAVWRKHLKDSFWPVAASR